jgi:hypothetical protein
MSQQKFSIPNIKVLKKSFLIITLAAIITVGINGLTSNNYNYPNNVKAVAAESIASTVATNISNPSMGSSSFENSSNMSSLSSTLATESALTETTKYQSRFESVKLSQEKKLSIPATGSKFGEIKINIPKDTVVKAQTPKAINQPEDQNIFVRTAARLMSYVGVTSSSSTQPTTALSEFKEESIQADQNPEIKIADLYNQKDSNGNPILGDSIKFEFGDPAKHLIFSKPVKVEIPTDLPNDSPFYVKVKHLGDTDFNLSGLTDNPNANCDQNGNVLETSKFVVTNNNITFYTCGASTFVVSGPDITTLEYAYPINGSILTSNYPTIGGSSYNNSGQLTPLGATIRLTNNGNVIGTTTVTTPGRWSLTPSIPLPDGVNTICGDPYNNYAYYVNAASAIPQQCITFTINP